MSAAECPEHQRCQAGDSLLLQRQQPSSATQPHPPSSCTGLRSWCWLRWAPRQPAPGSQDGLDHCHPAPHRPHATIPSVLLRPVLMLFGEDMVCPCCVACLCWQPCLPCPSWCSSCQAMARLGSGAHTQWGEYQHAQEWELLPLWSCRRNSQVSPAVLAQARGTCLAPPDLTPGTLGEVALCWGSAWNWAWHSEGCAGTTAPVGVHSC